MRSNKMCIRDSINRALSVKGGSAKLLYVYVDVEPVSFNRGFYTVDMRFFYHVTLQAYLSCPAPVTVEGLCVFDKRVILFGSEGNAKIFSSQLRTGEPDIQQLKRTNLPIAVVEAVDPIVLDARIMDCCGKRECDCDLCEVPSLSLIHISSAPSPGRRWPSATAAASSRTIRRRWPSQMCIRDRNIGGQPGKLIEGLPAVGTDHEPQSQGPAAQHDGKASNHQHSRQNAGEFPVTDSTAHESTGKPSVKQPFAHPQGAETVHPPE